MRSMLLTFVGCLILSTSAFAYLGNDGEFRSHQCGYTNKKSQGTEVCIGYIVGAEQEKIINGESYSLLYFSIGNRHFVAVDMNPQYGLNNYNLTKNTIELYEVPKGQVAPSSNAKAISALLGKQGNTPVSLALKLESDVIEVNEFELLGGAL